MNDPTHATSNTPGGRLLAAAAQMVAIERGDAEAAREFVYDGHVLVAVREGGETVWNLADQRPEVGPEDFSALRAALRQSQEGMAELLGVSVGTVRNWDQGRRTPRGPASQLIRVAAKAPGVLLDL